MIQAIIRKIFRKELEAVRKELMTEIEDMRLTLNSLQDEATKIDKQLNNCSEILTTMGMSDSHVPWWKDKKMLRDNRHDSDLRRLASKIEGQEERRYALEHPSLKKKIIFHGGCHGCKRPQKEGLKGCSGCQYFEQDWGYPSKFMD